MDSSCQIANCSAAVPQVASRLPLPCHSSEQKTPTEDAVVRHLVAQLPANLPLVFPILHPGTGGVQI